MPVHKSAKGDLLEKLVPVLLIASIGLAFAVGVLWQKVGSLEGGTARVAGTGSDTTEGIPPPAQPPGPTEGKLTEEQAARLPKVTDQDHLRGNRNAEVFLIEYSDFSCGFCARFHPTALRVLEEYGEKVAWVYRHFAFLSPASTTAALASECVAELGGNNAFWRFADKMFENHPANVNNPSAAVSTLGINQTAFQNCLESEEYADRVDAHYQGGSAAGVTGTPGNFLVNSKGEVWLVPGAVPFEMLAPMIDEALES